jgi:integrase
MDVKRDHNMNIVKKARKMRVDSYQYAFLQKFGTPITEYEAFKRATTGLDKATIKNYKNRLPAFFLYINEDPDTVINNRKQDIMDQDVLKTERYERLVKGYIKTLEDKNLSVQIHLNNIQGFFKNNSRRLRLEIGNLKLSKQSKNKKYSPSQEDVRRLNSFADCARDHLIVTLMFHHGLLPVDLAALRIGDYPLTPWVYFTGSRSKTGEEYHAVSTPDACKYLTDYLRLRGGRSGDPLFMGRKGPLDNKAISDIISVLIVRASFDNIPGFMPKCLRDGFADVLVDADVYLQVKEAMMGHGSNIYHQYGSEKKVAERVVEAMRKAYPLMCLSEQPVTTGGLNEQVLKEMASMLPALKILLQQQQQQQNNKQ